MSPDAYLDLLFLAVASAEEFTARTGGFHSTAEAGDGYQCQKQTKKVTQQKLL